MISLENKLREVAESYRFLAGLDVLDIKFKSGHTMDVYVAMDRKTRGRGLAGLTSLDTDGMLFFFEVATYVPFSMNDMLFDLNIAWYDESGKLIQSGEYKAGDPTPITCPKPFSYVLETPVGMLPTSDLSFDG
jgi:uncharacterized membrane protein (UPF0127 family)